MSNISITQKYRCWNDCKPSGCIGHEAKITYQSTSEALTFYDGRGQVFSIQTSELEAFAEILKELSESRVEIKSALDPIITSLEGK